MTTDLLLEIGTEELPARFVDGTLDQLHDAARRKLERLRLSYDRIEVAGSPRRLALLVFGLASRQTELVREMKGPAKRVAFDETGAPTRAAQGFARGQGVDVDALEVRDTDQGEYVYAVVTEAGLPAADLLGPALEKLLGSLHFPKSMRWGAGDVRFARPVRWLVALLGGELLPLTFAGLTAGDTTFGHRFLAPNAITLSGATDYVERLRAASVLVDVDERIEAVRREVSKAASRVGARVVADDDLLAEVANLVEYPAAVVGTFADDYLQLPRDVLITPMREHQRYFPLVDDAGRLLSQFIAVSNGSRADMDVVRTGNEKVLAARLADARFFYEEDRREPLAAYVSRLADVVFQEQLGTLLEKAERVSTLAAKLGEAASLGTNERNVLARAARLAKADLVTQMVQEFPELQGAMGKEYALLSGEDEAVAEAIYEHYLPRFAGDDLPRGVAGNLLSVADKLDTIVGCFAVDLVPTGSQDPFALRRQALGIVRIMSASSLDVDLRVAIGWAIEAYGDAFSEESPDLVERVLDFFRQRVRGVLADAGLRHDLGEAVIGAGIDDLAGTFARARALQKFSTASEFEALITAYERAANLAARAETDEVDAELLQTDAERELFAAVETVGRHVKQAVEAARYDDALAALATLRGPVDKLFDDVMVMAPEPELRRNRLALLAQTVALFRQIADLGVVVT